MTQLFKVKQNMQINHATKKYTKKNSMPITGLCELFLLIVANGEV